tara:strand:- start:2680 stop:3300 length:621 start_codon:yes stop_codon:yes gene_type:complete
MKITKQKLRYLIKESLGRLVLETLKKPKTLHVFDFDETLAETDSRVIITRRGEKGEYLTSSEYREYKKLKSQNLVKPGRENHRTFKRVKEGTMIQPVYNRYISLQNLGESIVIITARPVEAEPTITSFLESNQIINPEIYCTRGSKNKPAVLTRLLSQNEFEKVSVYEDDINNILMLKNTALEMGVDFEGFLVVKEEDGTFSVISV